METVGILLAGGQSRRYGSPKAFAILEGRFFYELAYEALRAVCDHVVVVSRPELLSQYPHGMDVIADLPSVAGQGPLAGIYTAMVERPANRYVVMPCDMPYIGQQEMLALIRLAIDTAEITAVKTESELIPLLSSWNRSVKETLKNELDNKQLGVIPFLKKTKTHWVDSSRIQRDQSIFRNFNTPD